jgi:peptide/nickel transport system permease protein
MLVYIVKRLLLLPLLLFIFSIVAFILIQAPPGDFVTSYVAELAASGSSMDQLQIEALRSLYGLDQPLYVQYFKWITRILHGDFGVSLDWQKPISELIGQRLLLTLALGVFTLLFTFAVAVPIGILSATRQYSFYDYFFTVFNYLGVATPSFMTALVLMWLMWMRPGASVGSWTWPSTSGCRS